MIGIKEECWRVHKALYGLDVSPRSWSLSRTGTLCTVEISSFLLVQNKLIADKQTLKEGVKETTPQEFAAAVNRLNNLKEASRRRLFSLWSMQMFGKLFCQTRTTQL